MATHSSVMKKNYAQRSNESYAVDQAEKMPNDCATLPPCGSGDTHGESSEVGRGSGTKAGPQGLLRRSPWAPAPSSGPRRRSRGGRCNPDWCGSRDHHLSFTSGELGALRSVSLGLDPDLGCVRN